MYRNHLSPPVFPYPWASDWGEDRYGLWMALTCQDVRHVFRWMMPGVFMMGSAIKEKGRYDREDQHQVTLSKGFWLAETTVTQVLWQAVMKQNPGRFKGEQRPVEHISWEDCKAFIEQLKQLYPDINLRLPWEAEWEYACRAGTNSVFNFGDELTLDQVNYNGHWDAFEFADDAKREATNVKSYACNDWGLYDMHGNVWEWCEDVWQDNLDNESVTDPWNQPLLAETGAERVIRGGSWSYHGRDVRSAFRSRCSPDERIVNLGFRLALGH